MIYGNWSWLWRVPVALVVLIGMPSNFMDVMALYHDGHVRPGMALTLIASLMSLYLVMFQMLLSPTINPMLRKSWSGNDERRIH